MFSIIINRTSLAGQYKQMDCEHVMGISIFAHILLIQIYDEIDNENKTFLGYRTITSMSENLAQRILYIFPTLGLNSVLVNMLVCMLFRG